MTLRPARQRRHVLYMQRLVRAQSPVTLWADVDVSRIEAERARSRSRSCSWTAHVVTAVASVLAVHPELSVVPGLGIVPRLARSAGPIVRVAVDRRIDGVRTVVSAVLRGTDLDGPDRVQAVIDRVRRSPADELAEVRRLRAVHRLPVLLGWPAFRFAVARSRRRPDRIGTVSVSTLSGGVDRFAASGGSALTVTTGRLRRAPLVIGEEIGVRPVRSIGVTFDHRVLDGAAAAEVLGALRAVLEDGGNPR
jgi:hypothetical protein